MMTWEDYERAKANGTYEPAICHKIQAARDLEWQYVDGGFDEDTQKKKVPGGWLYKTTRYGKGLFASDSVSTTFVPDAPDATP